MKFENFLIDLIKANGDRTLAEAVFGSHSLREIKSLLAKLSVTARHRPESLAMTSADEIVSLVRSAAVLEDMIGGVGSPTSIHVLLPLAREQQVVALDWVLRHTTAYSYYSGAKSAEEHLGHLKLDQSAKTERARKERERQEEDQKIKATRASDRLGGAIRRGDKEAVLALLKRGADREHRTKGGLLPSELAQELGQNEIAQLLDTFED